MTKPIRVFMTKFPYGSLFGGGEIHTMQLVDGLKDRGFSFSLLSSDSILLDAFDERNLSRRQMRVGLEPVSVKGLIWFTLRLPYTYWQLRRAFLQEERARGVSVLFCLSMTEKLLLSRFASKRGAKVVWMEHLRIERWLLSNPYLFWYKRAARFATVVGVSKDVARQLREDVGLESENVAMIYNGVDVSAISSSRSSFGCVRRCRCSDRSVADRSGAEDRMRLPQEQPNVTRKEVSGGCDCNHIIIGSIGRLCTEKGYDVLFRAIAKAQRELGSDIDLSFEHISEGPEKESLERLASDLGIRDKIKFHGFQRDVAPFLAQWDMLALTPVRRESFGIVAAEASAAGLPVIATDLSGLSEVVEDGETGIVCSVGDVEAIASAIVRLTRDSQLRMRMGEAGRKRVEENFSLDRMLDSFADLFCDSI